MVISAASKTGRLPSRVHHKEARSTAWTVLTTTLLLSHSVSGKQALVHENGQRGIAHDWVHRYLLALPIDHARAIMILLIRDCCLAVWKTFPSLQLQVSQDALHGYACALQLSLPYYDSFSHPR